MLENTTPSINAAIPLLSTWRRIISGGKGAFEQMACLIPRSRSWVRTGTTLGSTFTIRSQHICSASTIS